MSLSKLIQENFKGKQFSLFDLYEAIPEKPHTTLRARIYEGLGIHFERLDKGIYKSLQGDNQCILIEGDGRNLSMLDSNSIDCIITDHPWASSANIGGNRNFAKYDCFQYELSDFKEKARVLKPGSFLVEILPAENESNYEYLYQIKRLAAQCGLEYYSKVPWKKGSFVSNTGRKAKNTEDIMIFSKGKARSLRIDAKKTKATGEEHYMSGTKGMLPTEFDVQAVPNNKKIHDSEKPIKLYELIVEYVTRESEVILDQYAGSGSLGKAALNKNRNCILIEKLKENVEKIKDRLGMSSYDICCC